MSRFLYQTFYKYNKFDEPGKIKNLEKWMFSKDVLESFALKSHPSTIPSISILDSKPMFCIPKQIDTLFWSLYISHYGESAYLLIGNKYGNAEIAEKQKVMEFLKSNKYALKQTSSKVTLGASSEIMSELMTNKTTSLLAVNAFMVYYKKNILIQNTFNNTYVEYLYSSDPSENEWIVIQYKESNGKSKYAYFTSTVMHMDIEMYRKGNRIENPEKPLKGISTYKLDELWKMLEYLPEFLNDDMLNTAKYMEWKTKLESSIKKSAEKKQELYTKLWQSLLWV